MSRIIPKPCQIPPLKNVDDCHFYHSIDLPGLGVQTGYVDLCGHEEAYLGYVNLEGKTVLDVGPANGGLTFFMEKQGAQVTVLDLDHRTLDHSIVQQPDLDMGAIKKDRIRHLERIRNAFWFAYHHLESNVEVVEGNIEHIQDWDRQFDIVFLGGVLLHCRDCVGALQNAAKLCRETLIVTEQKRLPIYETNQMPLSWFRPSRENQVWDVWWHFTPGFFQTAIPIFGFDSVKTNTQSMIFNDQTIHHMVCVASR